MDSSPTVEQKELYLSPYLFTEFPAKQSLLRKNNKSVYEKIPVYESERKEPWQRSDIYLKIFT